MAVAEAIRESGTIPSGLVYSATMSVLSLEAFEKVVGILECAKLVKRGDNHTLVWVGPEKEAA